MITTKGLTQPAWPVQDAESKHDSHDSLADKEEQVSTLLGHFGEMRCARQSVSAGAAALADTKTAGTTPKRDQPRIGQACSTALGTLYRAS